MNDKTTNALNGETIYFEDFENINDEGSLEHDFFEWMLDKLTEKGYTRTQLIDMSDNEIEKAYKEKNNE